MSAENHRATAGLVYSRDLAAYDFGPHHPMRPVRLELTADLIDACGLLGPDSPLVAPRPATREELLRAHAPDYLDAVARAGAGELDSGYGLGVSDNPIFARMDEVSALICGASIVAVEKVVSGEWDHAFAIAGGLHHAMRARASGFCILNDAAVAIHAALARGLKRVLYVDFDAHHGDGVQQIFYDDPRVLTISIHESGRTLFPGTGSVTEIGRGAGEGFAVNVPLEAFSSDEAFLEALVRVVPPLARAFAPDLVVTQNGCDAHMEDPLTHLAITLEAHARAVALLHDLAHEVSGGRLVALGGGGYSIYRVVPVAWTRAFATLAGRELPDRVPERWRERCRAAGSDSPPAVFTDDGPGVVAPGTLESARRTARWIEENVFPRHGALIAEGR
jgi:acetoin utilization protein AcuC